MTSSFVGPTRSSKALPKAKFAPKKGHCLVVCCWSDSLQLPESWRSHYIWEVCSANQWDALKTATLAAALVNRKGPVLLQDNVWPHVTQPVLQKLRELSYGVLPHPPYSPDLLPTEYHLFKSLENLLQEKHIHNQQETENAFQEFIESWSAYFYATGISKFISCWQKCVDCQFSSVTQSCLTLCDRMDCSMPGCSPCPCPSPTPRVYLNSWLLSWWCHPVISSSVVPFFSCLQSFPAWGSFPMSQFFASGDWSIIVSASASVLPMNIQDWSPLGWTGWISLQSKGLSRVFSNTTVQKHQFFGAQLSL